MIILGATSLAPAQAQDLVYVAVEPCRLADTRKGGGVMFNGVPRNFEVSGANLSAQGGDPFGCVHPKDGTGTEPLAASVYIVSVPTASSRGGWFTAFPSDQIPPASNSVATLNYAKGQVAGNTTIATLCQPGSCPINGQLGLVSFNSQQHVVIDVQGYFYPQAGAAKGYVIVDFNDQIVGGAIGGGEDGVGPLIMSPQGYVATVALNNGKMANPAQIFFAGANCTGAAYNYLSHNSEEIDIGGGQSTYVWSSSMIGGVSNVWNGWNAGDQVEYWYIPKTPNLLINIPVQSLKLSVEDYIETAPGVWEEVETVECYATPAMTLHTAIEAFPNIPAVTGFPNTAFQAPLRYDYR